MRVSIAWLRELVDLPPEASASDIAERLTMAGLEVEAIDDLAASYANVVLARIAAVRPHPRADKLSVCDVDIGGEQLQVVCGAPNVKVGAIAVLARVGASVAGREIAAVELRGVASAGMLCSEKELGISDDASGILLLDEKLVPGTPFCQTLGMDSVVIDVAVTPNRPDALSHIGIARELAALRGTRIKAPAAVPPERGGPIDDAASVTISDPKGCPRYACRVVEGVEIGPSPAWLRERLQRCGVRSISNVVDITNLVLLERGHPLHAFDADRLGRDRGRAGIVVRRAEPGEKLTTLDGVERTLDPEDLLICDPDRPIALAGIMGGAASEVTARTTTVLIESAYFLPSVIRRTARRHGLHTEASHRFERGCDPNRTLEESLHRAAQLMAELCGGTVRRGTIDVYPKKIEPRVVPFRPGRAAALLGLNPKMVNEAAVGALFGPLGLEVASRDADAIHFRIPTWRPDLEREADLIEEAARLIGMDKIPETLPRGSGRMLRSVPPPIEQIEPRVRDALLAAGFDEALSLAFVSPREDALYRGAADPPALAVRNALGEEQSLLRRTLLVRLLAAVGGNQRRGSDDIRLFEIGTVFGGRNPAGAAPRLADPDGPTGGDSFAFERRHVAAVAVGNADPVAFDSAPRSYDFFDLKGCLESLLAALGRDPRPFEQTALQFRPADDVPGLHPRCAMRIHWRNEVIGVAGEVHPDVLAAFDLRGTPVACELDLDELARVACPVGQHQALPRFPKMRRDVALVLDDDVTVAALVDAVRGSDSARGGLLVDVDVFDIYRGTHVPPGKKSVALAFEYRAADRTLVDDEVNILHGAIVDRLVEQFRAEVRQ